MGLWAEFLKEKNREKKKGREKREAGWAALWASCLGRERERKQRKRKEKKRERREGFGLKLLGS